MSHPNVFSLPQNVPGEKAKKIKLQSILDSFPLRGTGEFHFRFKLATNSGKNGFSWVDVNDPNAVVPFYKGMLLAKLLRLDRPFYSGKQRKKDDWTFDARGSRPSNRRVKGEGKNKKVRKHRKNEPTQIANDRSTNRQAHSKASTTASGESRRKKPTAQGKKPVGTGTKKKNSNGQSNRERSPSDGDMLKFEETIRKMILCLLDHLIP